jgi:hypothetical protein
MHIRTSWSVRKKNARVKDKQETEPFHRSFPPYIGFILSGDHGPLTISQGIHIDTVAVQ